MNFAKGKKISEDFFSSSQKFCPSLTKVIESKKAKPLLKARAEICKNNVKTRKKSSSIY